MDPTAVEEKAQSMAVKLVEKSVEQKALNLVDWKDSLWADQMAESWAESMAGQRAVHLAVLLVG